MIEYYMISIGAMLLCGLIAGIASAKVHSAYNKYGAVPTRSHMTGYDTATKLLQKGGATDGQGQGYFVRSLPPDEENRQPFRERLR